MPYVGPAVGALSPLQAFAARVKAGNYKAPVRGVGNIVWGSRGMGQDDSDYYVPTSGDTSVVSMPTVSPTDTFSTWFDSLTAPPVSTPTVGTGTSGSTTSTSQPSTAAGIASILSSLSSAAAAGEKIYLSAQTPSVIPGTNAIYNPATGQYYNPTTGQVVNASGTSSLGIPTDLSTLLPSLLPWLLIGGVGLFALSQLEHH